MARLLQRTLTSLSGECGPDPSPGGGLSTCLVLGGPSRGKTDLVFLAAALTVSREGGHVLYVSPGPVRDLPSPLLALDPGGLGRIRFAYPGSLGELARRLASLHEAAAGPPPSLLVLEGLEAYLGLGNPQRRQERRQEPPRGAVLLCALLLDTVAYCGRKLQAEQRGDCQLIVTLQMPAREEGGTDQSLSAIERYFPVDCTVTGGVGEGGCGEESYAVRLRGLPSATPARPAAWLMVYEEGRVSEIHPVSEDHSPLRHQRTETTEG